MPLQLPTSEGKHIWLDIEKNGANAVFVAKQLAAAVGVQERDVGWWPQGTLGRPPTRQWFSIHLPKGGTTDLTLLQHPEFKALRQSRHQKKMRPARHQGA